MTPVRLITFDATGTLIQFKTPPVTQYVTAASLFGIKTDVVSLQPLFKSAFRQTNTQHPIFGRNTIGWEEWWKIVVYRTFQNQIQTKKDEEVVKKVSEYLIESFQTKNAWVLTPGTTELLQMLKEHEIKLGVISNFDSRLKTILNQFEIDRYFNFILLSYEFGFEKPDKRIFDEALRLSELRRNESLHVGDHVINDYDGAINAGWCALLFGKQHSHHNTQVFNDLFDLKKYLLKQI